MLYEKERDSEREREREREEGREQQSQTIDCDPRVSTQPMRGRLIGKRDRSEWWGATTMRRPPAASRRWMRTRREFGVRDSRHTLNPIYALSPFHPPRRCRRRGTFDRIKTDAKGKLISTIFTAKQTQTMTNEPTDRSADPPLTDLLYEYTMKGLYRYGHCKDEILNVMK
eukprot:GHVU01203274.1.p1 GENE.GHVU01203274.1~~GHVU01203274.1.p1  ORF type:complete len:170 (-),score=17.83 GHVU01203274.1:146-655(-)